jgi:NSS family neurotransmitter:Na+ symporter
LTRGTWGSTLGFILATSGAAVGLGNIQRFPYMVSQNGGSSFVFIYLICVLVIGLPLILVEFSIGRHTQRNPVCAIEKIKPKSLWKYVGVLGVCTAFFILSYYSVIGGWTIGYVIKLIFNLKTDIHSLASSPVKSIGYMAVFIAITMFIVIKGIHKGIERYSKIFMPILFGLIIILMIKSLSLDNSWEGVKYYLYPDFSQINAKIILLALSQAFFSLSIGEAVLVTYGSYAPKQENLVSSASYVAIFDTLIAFLSGLIIFPALFAFGMNPKQGVALTFVVLPQVFNNMILGQLFGFLFFVLLTFAALTTSIALLEIPVIYLIDSKKWKRKKAVWVIGILAFLIGIPPALSSGGSKFFSELHFLNYTGMYEIMDYIWGSLGMVITGGLLAVFTGWVWGIKQSAKELSIGCDNFYFYKPIWMYTVKFFAPICIFIIFLSIIF